MATLDYLPSTVVSSSVTPKIRILQWVSMDSAILFFAVASLVRGSKLDVAHTAALVTAAFELALLWADRRNRTRSDAPSETDVPTESQTPRQPARLPLACRKWAIALRVLLVAAWTLGFVISIVTQTATRVPNGYRIFRTIWIAFQLGVLGSLTTFCFAEQRALGT